ncbi:LysR family transcriptional regulator [Pyxidicoccus xibeiensis]|uniref:LysR family transcriptional regulator n=1 Tax=Pyxidicoccus xibeiensis TaxID=2906759 RepID=UPI0020A76F88|nr:LysR family transcriptional regulator [Pyxidicoccus xibeiensis]MCP3143869.1 LysR family transcriptional regulator [Pyxidicoccus xibeiensis]
MLQWDDLRYFLAVHRHGTHASAGRALRVAPTTIGRRLAALEEALGVKLFQRTPAGLVLGEAGQVLRAHAERVEAEVLASERELTGADRRVAGAVRVTAGDGMAVQVLAPRLPELQRLHPELRVELRSDNLVLDLSRREADVAVRLFRPREQSLIARRLSPFAFNVYGSEPYFARRGRPTGVKDAARHDWLGPEEAQDATPPGQWLRRHVPAARIVLRSNSTTVVMAACAAGLGLAVLPELLVANEPRLVPVLPRAALPTRELWAVTHQDLRHSARVAAVMDWLARLFATRPG